MFTASSVDDNEPEDKMSASENGQRQEVKEMKPISADGEYAKDLKTVYQGKAKNKRRMRRGGGDGNELMTEIESERGGGEIDILSSPEPQAWSPATVPDGLTERGKERCSCHS